MLMRVGESQSEDARGWAWSTGVGASLVIPGLHWEDPSLLKVIVPVTDSPHFNWTVPRLPNPGTVMGNVLSW